MRRRRRNPAIRAEDHPEITRASYPGVFQDTDQDTIYDVDDPFPLVPGSERVEEVSLAHEIGELIDLRQSFDAKRVELVDRLEGLGIPGKIKSRTKTPFSIINKLRRKRILGEHGLTDVVGAMLIVPDRESLEEASRAIESGDLGEVLERVDFYSRPLGGYRARHFILSLDGLPAELQLKTRRMALLANSAHHAYKTGNLHEEFMDYISSTADHADQGDPEAAAWVDDLLGDPARIEGLLSRENPFRRLNPERVTFGKQEQSEPGSSEGYVYLDGKDTGEILGHYHDFGSGMGNEYRVIAYTATIWHPDDEDREYELSEDVRGVRTRWPDGGTPAPPGAARKALSTLRKRIRDLLDPRLKRLTKGVYGPREIRRRKNPAGEWRRGYKPSLSPRAHGGWLAKRGGQDLALTDIPDEHILAVLEWFPLTRAGRSIVARGGGASPGWLRTLLLEASPDDYRSGMSSYRRQSTAAVSKTLRRLTRSGQAEVIPGTKPATYRISVRENPCPYLPSQRQRASWEERVGRAIRRRGRRA